MIFSYISKLLKFFPNFILLRTLKVSSVFELTVLSIISSASFPIFSIFAEKSFIFVIPTRGCSLKSYFDFSFKYLLFIFGIIFFLGFFLDERKLESLKYESLNK